MSKARAVTNQLAVAIGLGAVPAAGGPVEVVEAVVAADVHVASQVDQPVRPVDQPGQEVGGEGVDRQHPGMPLRAGVAVAVAVDAGVVDDGIHPAELVDLVGKGPGLLGACEIPDNDCCTAVDQVGQRGRSWGVAGVDDDLVPLVEHWVAALRPRPWADPVMRMRDMSVAFAVSWV